MTTVKRCAVCGRFRHYAEADVFCIGCGHKSLEDQCSCGRSYEYTLEEGNQGDSMHCPRCGKALKGRSAEFDP